MKILLVALLLMFVVVGCNSNQSKTAQEAVPSQKLEKEPTLAGALYGEITPTADGGAYISTDGALWYLRGGEAIRVREVKQLTPYKKMSNTNHSYNSLWALYSKERSKRVQAEYERDNPEDDNDEHDSDYSDYN